VIESGAKRSGELRVELLLCSCERPGAQQPRIHSRARAGELNWMRDDRVCCGSSYDCARAIDRAHSSHEYTRVSERVTKSGGRRCGLRGGFCAPRDTGVSTPYRRSVCWMGGPDDTGKLLSPVLRL